MLTVIRNWLDIRPESDMDEIFFYEDGWKAVLFRGYIAFCCIVEGPTTEQRRRNYAKRQELTVLDDGSIGELVQYTFTPQGVIDRYDLRMWLAQCALKFDPKRRAVAFSVVTPSQR